MLTKAQARTLVQQWIDDPSGVRWPASSLDLVVEQTLDDLWTDVLDTAPMLTSKLDTITLTAPGYVDARLVADGGQLSERLYRIQDIVRDGRAYRETDARDVLLSNSAEVVPTSTYARYGDQFWLLPLSTSSTVEFRYSFKPTRFSLLSEAAYVPFPEGHESAYVFEAAARALDKGTAEDSTALSRRAAIAYQRLLSGVTRNSRGPLVPYSSSSDALDWGGV